MFNEVDVLEIRLAELDEVVDVFVIAEATTCFSGRPKPLHFLENEERFAPWRDKIRYTVVDDMPGPGKDVHPANMFAPSDGVRWDRENWQREALTDLCSEDLADDDLVHLSDLDEIPMAQVVEDYEKKNEDGWLGYGCVERLFLPQHVMYLNWRWAEPDIVAINRFMSGKTLKGYGAQKARTVEPPPIQGPDQGWHFSYMGGPEMIAYKAANAAHVELAVPEYTDLDRVKDRMERQVDMFDRAERKPFTCPIRDLPFYVTENLDKFDHLIYKEQL